MNILVLRRHSPETGDPDSIGAMYTQSQIQEMLPHCDYLTMAAPLTRETRGMIGDTELAALRPQAVVINVARGALIQEAALIKALAENRVRGAALDVFEHEPLPSNHPFYKLENVLLSPHCADHTPEWLDQAMDLFCAQFERFQCGKPLINVVDKHLGY